MLVGKDIKPRKGKVEFVSYTGKSPCLCQGILTLKIDKYKWQFGGVRGLNPIFWRSGGQIEIVGNYEEFIVSKAEWEIDVDKLCSVLKPYAEEIDKVFNENVPFGCCGGCI